jgi:hypothetical protein
MPPSKTPTPREQAAATLELRKRERNRRLLLYRDHPEKYARDELNYRLTESQELILRSYAENRRTAVKASHAVGKSLVAAIAANHWYDCWDQHIVYVTAPTWSQAFDRTFKQIKIIRREKNLPGIIQETGFIKDENKLSQLGHFIQALNAETGEGFQGEHTAPILMIFEEAVGVKPYMWEAAEGMMTHPECFPAGTMVAAAGIKASTTRWYSGEVVEIRTRDGREASVTPNHPILTAKGWVAAGLLDEGDDLICCSDPERMAATVAGPDDYQVPTRIEDVAGSRGGSRGVSTISVPTAPEDFHGDGVGSEVHVVRADSHLWDSLDPTIREPSPEGDFILRTNRRISLPRLGGFDEVFDRLGLAVDRSVGGFHMEATLLARHPRHANSVRIANIAGLDPALAKDTKHGRGGDVMPLGDDGRRSPGSVVCNQGGEIGRNPSTSIPDGLGHTPSLDPSPSEAVLDRVGRDPVLQAQFDSRFPGLVVKDKVVEIRRVPFCGHVYNLQTRDGWYLANGLFAHNCRILSLANPTNENSHFGFVCTDDQESRLWNVLTVSVFEHPNIDAELECLPPLVENAVRLQWLREMLEKNCERIGELAGDAFKFWSIPTIQAALDGTPVSANPAAEKWFYKPNAEFQGRALGIFPTQADEQVIPGSWIDMLLPLAAEGEPRVGCDVAHKGSDRTAIAGCVGPCVTELRECRQYSPEAVSGACIESARTVAKIANRSEYEIPIRIDVTGGLGAGPVDALVAQGYNAIGVNFSESSKKHKEFPNVRSEVWWEVRERIRTRDFDLSHLPVEMRKKLVRELRAPKIDIDRKGRRIVQSKKDIKKELGGMSPDLAEAVCIAYAPDHRKVEYPFHRTSIKGWF